MPAVRLEWRKATGNISVQVIAFMGVVWYNLNSKRLCTPVKFADLIKGL